MSCPGPDCQGCFACRRGELAATLGRLGPLPPPPNLPYQLDASGGFSLQKLLQITEQQLKAQLAVNLSQEIQTWISGLLQMTAYDLAEIIVTQESLAVPPRVVSAAKCTMSAAILQMDLEEAAASLGDDFDTDVAPPPEIDAEFDDA